MLSSSRPSLVQIDHLPSSRRLPLVQGDGLVNILPGPSSDASCHLSQHILHESVGRAGRYARFFRALNHSLSLRLFPAPKMMTLPNIPGPRNSAVPGRRTVRPPEHLVKTPKPESPGHFFENLVDVGVSVDVLLRVVLPEMVIGMGAILLTKPIVLTRFSGSETRHRPR